ncbi:Serine/threonine-protein kinase PLK4 [Halotydeus destructor]|nr:Serine/threonine-protein kinase PLK4 [Halotydeus destructor]
MTSSSFSDSIVDYDLQDLIGVGSFGRVYRAQCKTNNRLCAVKCIAKKSSKAQGAPNISKIYAEVAVHLKLRHQNVIQLFNVIEDEDNVYLILELCHGGSLSHLVKKAAEALQRKKAELKQYESKFRRSHSDGQLGSRHQPMPCNLDGSPCRDQAITPVLDENQIRTLLRQLLSGLQYLHRNNIVHRDLNLNNLLLREKISHEKSQITVKIADFGLALDYSQSKHSGMHQDNIATNPYMTSMVGKTICGTPGYISPEVWTQATPASPASDMFGVGSILYTLITGVVPKGDIDLTGMPTWAADLITRLLDAKPENRLSIDEVLCHPYVTGPLNTLRLSPITKITKKITFMITEEGQVSVDFGKSKGLVKITKDGLSITVIGKHQQSTNNYHFESLPQQHWKKYLYAYRFVHMVKTKTAKIIYNCQDTCKVSSIDLKGNRNVIVKCCVLESGDFEVTVRDRVSNELQRITYRENYEGENPNLTTQIQDLREHCMHIEMQLDKLSKKTGFDSFPLTIGKRNKPSVKFKSPDVGYSTMYSKSSHCSSNFLKSLNIQGLGTVTQLPSGVLEVDFGDGSSLSVAADSKIVFSTRTGTKECYTKGESIPGHVKHKLSLLPTAISQLRQKFGFTHMSC